MERREAWSAAAVVAVAEALPWAVAGSPFSVISLRSVFRSPLLLSVWARVAGSAGRRMRAAQLVEAYPVVGLDHGGFEAARLLAERRLPGLIVVDAHGHPHTVLPGSQVLRFVIPKYVQEDVALARVVDERHADAMGGRLRGTRVRDLLPRVPVELPVVAHDATVMEIAAVMARLHSPLVAVVRDREILGAVTVSRLLGVLLERA